MNANEEQELPNGYVIDRSAKIGARWYGFPDLETLARADTPTTWARPYLHGQ